MIRRIDAGGAGMRNSAGKIRLTGFDDLFQTNGETQAGGEHV